MNNFIAYFSQSYNIHKIIQKQSNSNIVESITNINYVKGYDELLKGE